MLKLLNIENIAVIEKADIEFDSGLNAMTGETGAGKSIIVDSLNAILGERVSKELVRNGADNASVTALFCDVNSMAVKRIRALGYDVDEEGSLLISRKITANGKSTCKINGVACNVSMLREIGAVLVNIHGQHDSQALLNPDYHIHYVDMLSNEKGIYDEYKADFKRLIAVRKRLMELTDSADSNEKRLELLSYQIDELNQAEIRIGEIDELKARRELVLNSQAVINALTQTLNTINGSDELGGVRDALSASSKDIFSVKNVDKEINDIYNTLDNINEKVEELRAKLESKLESINFSPDELEKIEERLDMYYQFGKKYGSSERDMLEYLDKAISERELISSLDEELQRLSAEYDEVLNKTLSSADALSEHRKMLAKKLENDVREELKYLDMPSIDFIVEFDKGKISSSGYDKVEFLISTNAGEPPKPLSKIASGGELSRIMLAIKNILAENDYIQTLVFDEIDTGVSGRASRKIGLKLKSVSKHTQVICVTHSAQITACADNHLLISKRVENGRTYTSVEPLDHNGRVWELARIMGGLEITDALLKSAEELLIN